MAALAVAALLLVPACRNIGKERLLPRPEPMAVHADGALSAGKQRRLADIRRFLDPLEQQLLEQTIENLAVDERLPEGAGDEALIRAIDRTVGNAAGFCGRFVDELRPLMLRGPEAAGPEKIAYAIRIDDAYERWITEAARSRFETPLDLGRAIRDRKLERGAFNPSAPLGTPGDPLFVTDAAEFDKKGPSAAGRMCLPGKPAHSYVIAIVPASALSSPLRVPTAADGACIARFQLPPQGATAGETCTGRPQYVTATPTLEVVEEFRLSR